MIKVCGKDIRVEGRLVKIARIEGDKYFFPERPEDLVEGVRNSGARIDLFTFMQKVTEPSPRYAYPMEWDNFAALPVSTFDRWWTQQIGFKARNKAKQAEKKGVQLREVPFDDSLVRGICEIYNECPIRQGKRVPYYGMSFDKVREYTGTFLDFSIFIGAFLDSRLIGFAKLTFDENRTQMGLMHIISMIQHRDKAPTNALVAQAVRCCAKRGIGYLVYSNFAYGKKQEDSLSDFKKRNGFEQINVPRYYVPLTPLGWAAFRLGFHHKLADYVPEAIAVKLRNLRAAWYSHKYQLAKES